MLKKIYTLSNRSYDKGLLLFFLISLLWLKEINYLFYDINETLAKKIEAMQVYTSETREFPHPRSLAALEVIATRWGTVCGLKAAEAFQNIREIR